jgi:hypothetical protein
MRKNIYFPTAVSPCLKQGGSCSSAGVYFKSLNPEIKEYCITHILPVEYVRPSITY